MLAKLERKIGKYAIPNLMNYLIAGYLIGYLLQLLEGALGWTIYSLMTLEPHYIIHGLQFWRIITWVLIPPATGNDFFGVFFAAIMMFFYWQLGRVLEQQWGTFRFNVYIFGGIIFTIIGAFLLYVGYLLTGFTVTGMGGYFSTNYINLSIFLAFAVMYPDMRVLLYFIIPIKMKWMAIVYAIFMGITIVQALGAGNLPVAVAIVASLLNFGIFYIGTKNSQSISPQQRRRQNAWKQATGGFAGFNNGQGAQGSAQKGSDAWERAKAAYEKGGATAANRTGGSGVISRHKCAICGRTELTNPDLEFRFCSKCNGNYEYCNDHLFTHKHVE